MAVPARTSVRTAASLIAGPLLAGITLLLMPADPQLAPAARTAAVAVWMAAWWLTEAVPLAVTSLLPLALFPLAGILKANDVAGLYMNDVVFLFVGGFLVALAMEKWDLHRRIALRTILFIGGGTRRTLLGFMAATAFISMWTSNTATAMMMVPIASAVLLHYDRVLEERSARRLAVAMLLGVAYAASIGGMATLVGTPPNLIFARMFAIQFPSGPEITFATWMFFAAPLSAVLLIAAWLMLVLMYVPHRPHDSGTHSMFRDALRELGPLRREELIVSVTFLVMVVLWITRESLNFGTFSIPGWSTLLPAPAFVGDGTVAITLATLLFVVPARDATRRIIDWETARGLPWSIVLLFGGGFALAGAIGASGLDDWIGLQLQGFANLPPFLTIVVVCAVVIALSEFASNTATAQMALPILAAAAVGLGRNPLYFMVPATLAASCGFMMPVATPPNSIVFASGRIRIAQMARSGFLLNLISLFIISVWLFLAGPAILGGSPAELPSWAVSSTITHP